MRLALTTPRNTSISFAAKIYIHVDHDVFTPGPCIVCFEALLMLKSEDLHFSKWTLRLEFALSLRRVKGVLPVC